MAATSTSIASVRTMPTTRIVFDENVAPATTAMRQWPSNQYINALSDVVDIWEVGNEINGEWLGSNADVVAKMTGAYDLVKAQNKTAALTLYYNKDCWSRKSNEMFTWANNNVSPPHETWVWPMC